MIEIRRTAVFLEFVSELRDARAIVKIARRVDRLEQGNPGDVKAIGEGVSEMRIDYGPRLPNLFLSRGAFLVILLCGDDKKSQEADIKLAKKLAREVEI